MRVRCRVCRGRRTTRFLRLGPSPLANAFLRRRDLKRREPRFPLDVHLCRDCGLVQISDVVDSRRLFSRYLYVTGTSESMRAHFARMAADLTRALRLGRRDLVVDVGSNDGTLLKAFRRLGPRVLGVEPAGNLARAARAAGVPTANGFFTPALAGRLAARHGRASLLTAANVFAHVTDPHAFVEGARRLLAPGGAFVFEAPYLLDLLDNLEFDTIYHEHRSYLAVRPLLRLFEEHGMRVADVRRMPVHGGSLRVLVRNAPGRHSARALRLAALERRRGLGRLGTYRAFAAATRRLARDLRALLVRLRAEGARVAGYGAPAKSTTLLNYAGIGPDLVGWIADKNPMKQGLYAPGTRIPIRPLETLAEDMPDYLLILPWNIAREVRRQERAFRRRGGRFILPVPRPRITR